MGNMNIKICLLICGNVVHALCSYHPCEAVLCLFQHTANVCNGSVTLCVCMCVSAYVCLDYKCYNCCFSDSYLPIKVLVVTHLITCCQL
jgi:hypothetical protein